MRVANGLIGPMYPRALSRCRRIGPMCPRALSRCRRPAGRGLL